MASMEIRRGRFNAHFEKCLLDPAAKDTITTKFGEIPNKEWLLRFNLRVETRLKLLAKWDPEAPRVEDHAGERSGFPIESG